MTQEQILVNFDELPNYGVLSAEVPKDILDKLNYEVNKMITQNFVNEIDYRENLLGHLSHEYRLDNCLDILEPFVVYLTELYDSKWNYIQTVDEVYNIAGPKKLKLHDLWVNVQQKHEFNPPHVHTGIMSFALWLKIPYDIDEEEKVFPKMTGAPRTSKFSIHYNNILGQLHHYALRVDKSYEGKILVFPSSLSHSVSPFYTTDEYRISVAGNLRMVSA